MGDKRASIFDDEESDFDVSDFAQPQRSAARARPDDVRRISEAQDFKSRESAPQPRQRRHRTGRNMQLNMKVRPEAAERLNSLCDVHGWVQGEALEYALDALEREIASKG
jgi:hypothetical protein